MNGSQNERQPGHGRFLADFEVAFLRFAFGSVMRLAFLLFAGLPLSAEAVTYAMTTVPYNWVDASTHSKLTTNSAPYKFNGGGLCGTELPKLDDVISDSIPLGFNFMYGGATFTSVQVMTNGRLQFGNTTCGAGTQNVGPPQTFTYPYPNTSMNYTMRVYGGDLDVSLLGGGPDGAGADYPTTCTDRNSCYISYATVGTAPYRSFIVTWSNVPEWVSYTQTAGNFNLQVILQENGEFIYQFGSNNYASSGRAQIGWQVDNTTLDYEVSGVGLPATGTAFKYYIPRPVAEYRMEQPSWNGTAGEVLDTSGYGRHGSRLGGPQTVANAAGYICRGASIPSNVNAATIDAINTGVNVSALVGSSGGISFWYKPTTWDGGAATAAMLFDATTANGEYFYLVKYMSGNNARLRFVVRDSGGNSRVAQTGDLTLDANGAIHIAVAWSFNPLAAANSDFVQIFANGARVANNAFTTANSISANLGTLYIGDNRSTFVENANYGRSAAGVIDEFRIYNTAIGWGLVLRDKNQANNCLSHYAVSHGGSGSTCLVTPITITAHNGSHNPIIMPNNTTQIRLSTSTGKGDWTLLNGYGVLDNGSADDGKATYIFNGEYQVVLGLSHGTSGTVNIDVTDGQIAELEDPSLSVASCGSTTAFNACEVLSPRCIPQKPITNGYDRLFTKLAGLGFNLDFVALQADGSLDTSFNKDVTVTLLANLSDVSSSISPSTNCPPSQTATIPLGTVTFAAGRATKAVTNTAFSSVSPNYSAYKDVRAKFSCDMANCDQVLDVCSTDKFAIRPQSFSIAVSKTDNSALNNASFASGTPSLIAGQNFLIKATGVAGYNGSPTIKRTVGDQTVATHLHNPPTTISYSGALRDASVATTIALGAATVGTGLSTGTVQYHDYGNFRLLAGGVRDSTFASVDVAAGDCVTGSYSNADNDGDSTNGIKYGCDVANLSDTGLYGRFFPIYFAVAGTLTPAVAVGNFTYFGQPFTVSYSVSAMSYPNPQQTDSVVMPSYAAGTVSVAAYEGTSDTDVSANIKDAATKTNRADVGGWSNGVFTPATTSVVYLRTVTPMNPLSSLYVAVSATDADGTYVGRTAAGPSVITDRDLKAGTPACSGASCTHKKLSGVPTLFRYGRLQLQKACGKASNAISMPSAVEVLYYTGAVWSRNTLDSSTDATPSLAKSPTNLGTTLSCSRVGCVVGSGLLGFDWTAPNTTGYVDLSFPALSYLWYPPAATSPVSRVSFGIYCGQRAIFRRERY